MVPPLSLERYAELSAELDAGTPRDELLAREQLPLADWHAAQHYWLGNIGAEATRLRYELAHRYGALFRDARKAAVARRNAKQKVALPDATSGAGSLKGSVIVEQQVAAAPLQQGLGASNAGPRLTLAQWAALCAEVAVFPGNADAIHQRYGFDPGTLAREHAEWENTFAANQREFDEYLARFRYYRDWFLGGRAGP